MSDLIVVISGNGTSGQCVARRLDIIGAKVAIDSRRHVAPLDRSFDWADLGPVAAFDGCFAAYVVASRNRIDHLDVMRHLL